MNTLLAPQRPSGLPDTLQLPHRQDQRVTVVDRVAMRVGLRLLLWSTRRPRLADDRTRHAETYRHEVDAARRERDHLRATLLAPRA